MKIKYLALNSLTKNFLILLSFFKERLLNITTLEIRIGPFGQLVLHDQFKLQSSGICLLSAPTIQIWVKRPLWQGGRSLFFALVLLFFHRLCPSSMVSKKYWLITPKKSRKLFSILKNLNLQEFRTPVLFFLTFILYWGLTD